jgi:hypothetical protein
MYLHICICIHLYIYIDVDIKKDVSWSIEYDDGSMAVLNYEELR